MNKDLNLIVTLYLDFAELQARSRKPMYMTDWIAKLDEFLRLSDREILTHQGRVSHDAAVAQAEAEYEKFRTSQASLPSPVERHFEEAVTTTRQIAAASRSSRRKSHRH